MASRRESYKKITIYNYSEYYGLETKKASFSFHKIAICRNIFLPGIN